MKKLDQILENRIARHVLFWVCVVFAAPLFSEGLGGAFMDSLIYRVVGLPLKIMATYLLVYYQIPQFFQKKKYFLFGLSFAISTYVFCVIYRVNNIYIAEALAGSDHYKETFWEILNLSWWTVNNYFIRVYGFSLVFILLKYGRDRMIEKRKLEALLKEKATAELNFLKAQIHPHFLFNTLNNLYALTLEKSDDAPEVVAKLSEILDYMLYQCNDPTVLVSKEVELIQHYIDLEKLRYGDRLSLHFSAQIDDPQIRIAPLILLSIVENAFKHGASGSLRQPVINIDLVVQAKRLHFKVFNTKALHLAQDERAYRKGIGTDNIKRQLELVYPSHHEWCVEEGEEDYEVQLKIEL